MLQCCQINDATNRAGEKEGAVLRAVEMRRGDGGAQCRGGAGPGTLLSLDIQSHN